MIRAVLTVEDGIITGFSLSGHADFAEQGSDIVCAAVSSAAYMAANTVTDVQNLPCSVTADDGYMESRTGAGDTERSAASSGRSLQGVSGIY